jgi:hypothetical protein
LGLRRHESRVKVAALLDNQGKMPAASSAQFALGAELATTKPLGTVLSVWSREGFFTLIDKGDLL